MKKILTILLLLLTAIAAKSQDFSFTYDNNGNRTMRTIIYLPSKVIQDSSSTDSTANTTDSVGIASINHATQQQQYEAMLGEQKITVYPNPTKGELQIDISNFALDSKGSILVTDMQGRIIINNENINSANILNLSSVANGNYILKILLNDTSKEWLIIKE